MDKAQEPDPITNGVLVLLAPDNACVRYALGGKPEKIPILGTNDASHLGSARQMNGIISL